MPVSACDIVRDALAAGNLCKCDGSPAANALPQCTADGKTVATPPPSCAVLAMASYKDTRFKWQFTPYNPFDPVSVRVRDGMLADITRTIDAHADTARAHYGADAPVDDVSYWTMQRCLANADGSPDSFGDTYVSRAALIRNAGYGAQPLVGGLALSGRIPAESTALTPVLTDRLANPSLFLAVLLIVLLAVLLGILRAVTVSGSRAARGRPEGVAARGA